MKSLSLLLENYAKEGLPHLRLGQYFVAFYIKYSWPELFYERDYHKALASISMWLEQHHYYDELPQKVNSVSK